MASMSLHLVGNSSIGIWPRRLLSALLPASSAFATIVYSTLEQRATVLTEVLGNTRHWANLFVTNEIRLFNATWQILTVELPDLIPLDLMMSSRDSFEVVRRIQAVLKTATVAIIIVTALYDVGSHARAVTAGISERISNLLSRWTLRLA